MNRLRLWLHRKLGHNWNIKTGICADCGDKVERWRTDINLPHAVQNFFGRIDGYTLRHYKNMALNTDDLLAPFRHK